MILALIEIGAIASLAVYLGYWRAGVRRRRAQAWDRLVVQLQPNWIARELGNQSSWNEEQDATPEEIWRGVQGANGLWAMYEHAGVMLNMADYAARNSDSVDRELLAAFRNDAMQIRVCVLTALARYACSQINENTCVSVSRATAIYADMVSRTAELLRMNGGALAPNFAGTM